MSKKTLIVDGNNRLYAAYFAYDQLSYNGKSTACIYGVPTMLRALIGDLKPDKVLFVWDGLSELNPRRKLLPAYKEHRKDNLTVDRDDIIRQKLLVQKCLRHMGITQYRNKRFEADDLMYALTLEELAKGNSVILNSGDKDFHQMLDKDQKITIYSESRKTLLTYNNLKSYFGYSADELIDWLCMMGDSSDDIPGVPGVGEKTARALLDKYGNISNFLSSKDSFPRVNKEKLLAVYKINRKLISLELFYKRFYIGKKINYVTCLKPCNPKLDMYELTLLAGKYGIKRLLDPNFIKPFKTLQK